MYNLLDLFKGSSTSPVTGRIVSKPTSTLCLLEDSRKRQFQAESDGSYRAGQWVLVKDGIIISRAKKVKSVSHFNV